MNPSEGSNYISVFAYSLSYSCSDCTGFHTPHEEGRKGGKWTKRKAGSRETVQNMYQSGCTE